MIGGKDTLLAVRVLGLFLESGDVLPPDSSTSSSLKRYLENGRPTGSIPLTIGRVLLWLFLRMSKMAQDREVKNSVDGWTLSLLICDRRKAPGPATSIGETMTFFWVDWFNWSYLPMKTPISLSRVLRVPGLSSPRSLWEVTPQQMFWYLDRGARFTTRLPGTLMASVTLKLSMEAGLGTPTFLPSKLHRWNFLPPPPPPRVRGYALLPVF